MESSSQVSTSSSDLTMASLRTTATSAAPSSGSSVVTRSNEDDLSFVERDRELVIAIGAGSFGRVFKFRGHAYKVVMSSSNNTHLRDEYEHLRTLYKTCGRHNPPSSRLHFSLPVPLLFYDPTTKELRRRSRKAPAAYKAVSDEPLKIQFVTFLRRCPRSAVYTMELVIPIPWGVATLIRKRCYLEQHQGQPVPTICRIYLGRTSSPRPSRFFSHRNFPLDRERYWLLENEGLLPRASSAAEAMGRMLGAMHWKGRNDARDVEFVVAGSATEVDATFWTIDFNQTSTFADAALNPISSDTNTAPTDPVFDLDNDAIKRWLGQALAKPFFDNDPYFPRPRPGEDLYECFRQGYLAGATMDAGTMADKARTRAEMFLRVIEEMQKDKDNTSLSGAEQIATA